MDGWLYALFCAISDEGLEDLWTLAAGHPGANHHKYQRTAVVFIYPNIIYEYVDMYISTYIYKNCIYVHIVGIFYVYNM